MQVARHPLMTLSTDRHLKRYFRIDGQFKTGASAVQNQRSTIGVVEIWTHRTSALKDAYTGCAALRRAGIGASVSRTSLEVTARRKQAHGVHTGSP